MADRASIVEERREASDCAAARPAGIEVALATHQSALFLGELLDSLFAQTCQDFTILVSDDGSTDATADIVDDFELRFPGRIRRVGSGARPGGPHANFSRLIEHASADYLMLCDHDDVWLPNKIALCLDHMRELEARHGPDTPFLVHTDLIVVGRDLQILSPSFFEYQGLDPARNDLHALLMSNTVTGCATMVNRALYERARPIPDEAALHDHWLALVAASTGRISCIQESTILYRQHGANSIGAIQWGARSILKRVRETLLEDTKRRMLERFRLQAGALLERCGGEMSPEHLQAAAALASLWNGNRWHRFGSLRRNGFVAQGFLRNAALFVALAGSPPRSPAAHIGGGETRRIRPLAEVA
ncbi:MAG: glycosyltransferase family 2 protein [Allosphingosinicella sp.]